MNKEYILFLISLFNQFNIDSYDKFLEIIESYDNELYLDLMREEREMKE